MKLTFFTLACPQWNNARIALEAKKAGYQGVDLRCTKGAHVDPAMNPPQLREIRGIYEDQGLELPCLCGYTTFNHDNDAKLTENIDQGKRNLDVAAELGCGYYRTFAGVAPQGADAASCRKRAVEGLKQIGDHGRSVGVRVGLETHDEWAKAETAMALVQDVGTQRMGIVWDTMNSWTLGVNLLETAKKLGGLIEYIQLKDAKVDPKTDERHYVLFGEGDLPRKDFGAALKTLKYEGWICFEWEKMWHPEIEEPEVALPHFVKSIGKYII
jgi:sugar phosphate isomerase/epimerase